ncbi:TPA: hypothetical protein ACULGJ_004651, partial [Escherichia coli]
PHVRHRCQKLRVESAGENFPPPAAHGTVHDTLASYGSCSLICVNATMFDRYRLISLALTFV